MQMYLPSGKSKDLSAFIILQHLFKAYNSWPCTVPYTVRSCVPVASVFGQLVLHRGRACAIMCNYGGVCQQIHGKSSLQITCTYR